MKIGPLIDRMYQIKLYKAGLQKQIDGLNEEYDNIELQVLGMLDDMGLDSAKAETALATKSETSVPVAVDWDALNAYIVENNALYLLQRRPAVTALKELFDSGETIPGVELRPKTTLSLRKRVG